MKSRWRLRPGQTKNPTERAASCGARWGPDGTYARRQAAGAPSELSIAGRLRRIAAGTIAPAANAAFAGGVPGIDVRNVLITAIQSSCASASRATAGGHIPKAASIVKRRASRAFRLHRTPGADDGGGRAVRVRFAGRPGGDGEAHDPQPLPLRAGGKAGAVGLDARDHLAGQDIVGGVVAAEAHNDLVELHFVQHADAGFLAQRVRHAARDAAMMGDQLCDTAAAERADHRPGGETPGAARELRHVVRWIALAGSDRGQIARGDRHRAAVRRSEE